MENNEKVVQFFLTCFFKIVDYGALMKISNRNSNLFRMDASYTDLSTHRVTIAISGNHLGLFGKLSCVWQATANFSPYQFCWFFDDPYDTYGVNSEIVGYLTNKRNFIKEIWDKREQLYLTLSKSESDIDEYIRNYQMLV